MAESDSVSIVLSTFASEEQAAGVARALVGEGAAACVNLIPGVRSIYRWNGEVQDEREVMVVVKTRTDRADALIARLVELHPYQVPEAIALEPSRGHAAYLAWIAATVAP